GDGDSGGAREHSAPRIEAEAPELVDLVTLAIHRRRSERPTEDQKKPAFGNELPAGRTQFYAPLNSRPIRVGDIGEPVSPALRHGAPSRARHERLLCWRLYAPRDRAQHARRVAL